MVYVNLLIVSYINRFLLVNKDGTIPQLEFNDRNYSNDSVLQICRKTTSIPVNFILDINKCFYEENRNDSHYIYYWMFICMENYPGINSNYRWSSIDTIYFESHIKEYISSNLYKNIIAYNTHDNKTNRYKFNNSIIPIQSSKKAYSRIIPLKILYPHLNILNPPNILDSAYLQKALNLSNNTNGALFIDGDALYSLGIYNMLPLLLFKHRFIEIASPITGCRIGNRGDSLFLYILKRFGVIVKFTDSGLSLEYDSFNSYCDITVTIPFAGSFTATSMALYFSIIRSGTTTIHNASIEPSIIFLLEIFKRLGYHIYVNQRTLIIDNDVTNCRYDYYDGLPITIPKDRNILISRLFYSLYTGKKHFFDDDEVRKDESIKQIIKSLRLEFLEENSRLEIDPSELKDTRHCIEFNIYPALCTDWNPLFGALLAQNRSETVLYDAIFDNRFQYLHQFSLIYPRLQYESFGHLAVFHNDDPTCFKSDLSMHEFELLDIRAAAALFIILSKCSNYRLSNLIQFFRGHENISQLSPELGAKIKYEFSE